MSGDGLKRRGFAALPSKLQSAFRTASPEWSPTMTAEPASISSAFQCFRSEAPQHSQAWAAMIQGLVTANALDSKTSALAYLSVLAALRMESGVPFHVQAAKRSGASRDEVISAILLGLPAAGHGVTQALPAAITAYDAA